MLYSLNTKKDDSAKFQYFYYDNQYKNLYRIQQYVYSKDIILKTKMGEAILIKTQAVQIAREKLYISYTKIQLEEMMKDKVR